MRLLATTTKRRVVQLTFVVTTVAILIGAVFFSIKSATPALAQEEGSRLITLHDRGVTSSFMTTEATIEDALRVANVVLDDRDAVEPARSEKLVASDYQVNIYRARPVTVVDGLLKRKVFSPYQSSERIVKDVGISLYPEDITTVSRSDDVLGQGSGLQLRIVRAVPVTLDLYGQQSAVRTQGKTVAALLDEKKISLGVNDRVSPSLSESVVEGMSIRVWREGTSTITVEEAVPFTVEQIKDADRPVGFKEVKTAGVPGQRTVTYEVEIKNGAEVRRVEIASITNREATQQVEVVGSKPIYMKYTGGGNKDAWLAASNVPKDMWGYAEWLVAKESGWNPNAVNRSSGACGLAQALPCGKVPGNPHDPVTSLNWMNGYVNGRYGGWEGAVNHSKAKGWY